MGARSALFFVCMIVFRWTGSVLDSTLLSLRSQRHVPLGGTSAGLAVLGDIDFSAETGGIESPTALSNPYDAGLTFNTSFIVGLPGMKDAITDTHFVTRDRMGRLMAFIARMATDIEVSQTGFKSFEDDHQRGFGFS
jgi:cyanophycinase